jgi:hypothetical protein
MGRLVVILWWLLACISAPLGGQHESTEQPYTRRFAFIVGANRGGPGRQTLQYAVNDARAMKKVLQEMGGVQADDISFLAEPRRDDFLRAMKNLSEKIDQERGRFRRLEAIFYYSGHSDEENLLLSGERVSYQEFRETITAMNADVRIAILDSCASGAFTSPKGVARRSPFLLDTAYDMKGNAFMTSSSATEVAQESDRLRSSFFTYNLITGMRGAADMNRDDRITLSEAYQFAFNETLTQTERTISGPQHPNYHIQMAGTGDVVITEIWKSDAVLVLKADVAGSVYIHNHQNALVMKLDKPAGREISLGLNAGSYRVINISGQRLWEASVTLASGKHFELGHEQFEKIRKVPTASRGILDPPGSGRGRADWLGRMQLEIAGGLAALRPGDLNLRTQIDRDVEDFYYADYFAHKKELGDITSLAIDRNWELSPLRRAFPLDVRVKYRLNDWLALSLGCSYFYASESSHCRNEYTIVESSGSSYVYTSMLSPFTLAARGTNPYVGAHFSKSLSRSVRGEVLVTAGPVFAACLYRVEYNAAPLSNKNKILDFSELVAQQLEEKGSGTGLALYGGGRIALDATRNFGFFLEAGYARQVVRNVSGPGNNVINGRATSWEGEWEIKEEKVQEEWGSIDLVWPSNCWTEGKIFLRSRDFTLDLSGGRITVGVFLRL